MIRQSGFSLIGALIVSALLGFAGLFALKVGSLYYDHVVISAMVDDLKTREAEVQGLTERQIKRDLSTKLRVNGLDEAVPIERFQFERNGAQWLLTVNYERRTDFVDSVDLIVTFNVTARLGQP